MNSVYLTMTKYLIYLEVYNYVKVPRQYYHNAVLSQCLIVLISPYIHLN